ncbi:nicotinate-nucleotide adenylyltransferase [Marivibrio halodurans]|uniref:nicotinate-nucleotide adenylyltransferase n=1 Tax=Marivibrio halodurans TaxID=2039722 RepID=UPI0031BBA9A5
MIRHRSNRTTHIFPAERDRARDFGFERKGSGGRLTVGLLGGSFNPAHDGHRYISEQALKRLRLDQVWWLVSPQNPLKAREGMASHAERMASARSVARHPRIRVSDIESRIGLSHTADVLVRLRERYPRIRFVWLMGADNLATIHRWKHWHKIFTAIPIAVFARPSYDSRALAGLAATRFSAARLAERKAASLAYREPPAWVFLAIRRHPASATAIRAREGFSGS